MVAFINKDKIVQNCTNCLHFLSGRNETKLSCTYERKLFVFAPHLKSVHRVKSQAER